VKWTINEDKTMPSYRLCFFNRGKMVYRGDHDCADDREATELANEFCKDFEVEVWEGDRLVSRVRMDQAAIGS